MRHDPAVSRTRAAVRAALSDLDAGALVLAAVSGGADSLALAAALAHVGPRLGLRAGAVLVDHGLQPGSAAQSVTAAAACRALGLAPVDVVAVEVGSSAGRKRPRGQPGTTPSRSSATASTRPLSC